MKLTLKDGCLDDWYCIEKAEHDGRIWLDLSGGGLMTSARISDADVEGTAEEMLAIADAIERRDCESFRRCAVRIDGDEAFFYSPRNSQREGEVTYAEALELAKEIRAKLAKP